MTERLPRMDLPRVSEATSTRASCSDTATPPPPPHTPPALGLKMALRPHGPLGAWLSGPAGGVGSRGSACKQSEAGSRRTRRRGLFLATRSSYGARSSMMKIIMETSTWPPVPLLSRPHLPGTRVKSRHRGAVRLDFGLRSWRQSDPSTHRARRCAKALQGKSGQRVKKIVEILYSWRER